MTYLRCGRRTHLPSKNGNWLKIYHCGVCHHTTKSPKSFFRGVLSFGSGSKSSFDTSQSSRFIRGHSEVTIRNRQLLSKSYRRVSECPSRFPTGFSPSWKPSVIRDISDKKVSYAHLISARHHPSCLSSDLIRRCLHH